MRLVMRQKEWLTLTNFSFAAWFKLSKQEAWKKISENENKIKWARRKANERDRRECSVSIY